MKPSPIFNLINKTPANFPGMQLAEDKNNKPYWFKTIDSSVSSIELESKEPWTITEQHVTVYKEYDDNYNYITAYHVTLQLSNLQTEQSLLARCYFDINNVYRATLIKQEEQRYELPASRFNIINAKLRNYVEIYGAGIFSELNKELQKKQKEIAMAIQAEETIVEKLSENIEKYLDSYISSIERLLLLLRELDSLGERQSSKIKIYQHVLQVCKNKQQQEQKKHQEIEKIPKLELSRLSIEDEADISSDEKLPATQPKVNLQDKRKKLKIINQKISETEAKGENIYSLLNNKLNLLTEEDLDEIIATVRKINIKREPTQAELNTKILLGDENALDVLVEHGLGLKPRCYPILIARSYQQLFKKAYEYAPISLNMLYTFGGEAMTFLRMAYKFKHFNLFRYLLEICANPNVSDERGARIIHYIVSEGAVEYAKCLVELCPYVDLNSLPNPHDFNSEVGIIKLNPKDFVKFKQKALVNIIGNNLVAKNEQTDWTPIRIAVREGHEEMVKLLLEAKVDPLLDMKYAKDSQDIILVALEGTTTDRLIKPGILEALINKGCDINLPLDSKTQKNHLVLACELGNFSLIQRLVQGYNADINVSFKHKGRDSNLLILTTENRDFEIFEYLLTQEYVVFNSSTLSSMEAYATTHPWPKKFLDKAPVMIKLYKEKLDLIEKATEAYEKKSYQKAIEFADQASTKSLEFSKTKLLGPRLKLVQLLYLSSYALGHYQKAGFMCLWYINFSAEILKTTLHPVRRKELEKAQTQAEQHIKEIKSLCPDVIKQSGLPPPLIVRESKGDIAPTPTHLPSPFWRKPVPSVSSAPQKQNKKKKKKKKQKKLLLQ